MAAATSQPQLSSETARQTHQDKPTTTPSRAASIAATDTASILTAVEDAECDTGNTTPRALSLAPTLVESRTTYRGFPSQAAYQAAFHEWAESKRYIQQDDTTLIGFYGDTTMEEMAARPRVEFGLSRKWRERRERKRSQQGQGQGTQERQQGQPGEGRRAVLMRCK